MHQRFRSFFSRGLFPLSVYFIIYIRPFIRSIPSPSFPSYSSSSGLLLSSVSYFLVIIFPVDLAVRETKKAFATADRPQGAGYGRKWEKKDIVLLLYIPFISSSSYFFSISHFIFLPELPSVPDDRQVRLPFKARGQLRHSRGDQRSPRHCQGNQPLHRARCTILSYSIVTR